MAAFLGMRGNGDWVGDQRPKNWRETILRRYPNGDAPLTAILSKMSSERTTDPEFNWWTKSLATQRATITGIYTNTALDSAYTTGGVAGDTLYFKMSADDVSQWRIGHVGLFRDASDLTVDCVGKITARVADGASSYVAAYLLEADDNSSAGDLSDCDTALIIGSAHAEGAAMPDAIAYNPTKWYNFTQIFRNSLEMTRTAMQTKLRTGSQYKEAKRECLEMHSIEQEKAYLFGVPSELTGTNGKPERTTLGIIPAIRGGYTGEGGDAGTIDDFSLNATAVASGKTWLAGGEEWLDTQLEIIFRKGSQEKLAFAGSGALAGINRLIKNGGSFEYSSSTESYGIKVTKWVTPFGTINIMRHPLLTHEVTTRNAMVIFEPKDIKYRYIQDTMFKSDDRLKKGSYTSRDGIKEEYLTEAGLEYHHPDGWGFLSGFNTDNSL